MPSCLLAEGCCVHLAVGQRGGATGRNLSLAASVHPQLLVEHRIVAPSETLQISPVLAASQGP